MAHKKITTEQVKAIMLEKLGIRAGELAKELGVVRTTVEKHVKAIRKVWKDE